jgi:hypothetical protein
MAEEMKPSQVAERRDATVCHGCAHFEAEQEIPYCVKFKDWADGVVEHCGGPY